MLDVTDFGTMEEDFLNLLESTTKFAISQTLFESLANDIIGADWKEVGFDIVKEEGTEKQKAVMEKYGAN